jgi:hypothetical protein
MTDEELDAIAIRVWDDHRKGTMMFADDAVALIAEVRCLRAVAEREIERLHAALTDALEGMDEMLPYVAEFFIAKWDLRAYVDRAQKALDPGGDGAKAEPLGEDSPSVEG